LGVVEFNGFLYYTLNWEEERASKIHLLRMPDAGLLQALFGENPLSGWGDHLVGK
jgi:hypothetical protein